MCTEEVDPKAAEVGEAMWGNGLDMFGPDRYRSRIDLDMYMSIIYIIHCILYTYTYIKIGSVCYIYIYKVRIIRHENILSGYLT